MPTEFPAREDPGQPGVWRAPCWSGFLRRRDHRRELRSCRRAVLSALQKLAHLPTRDLYLRVIEACGGNNAVDRVRRIGIASSQFERWPQGSSIPEYS